MQQYVSIRRAPRGSKLVLSLIALARHAWHAPPAAECHKYIQGVRGVNAGYDACRAAAQVLWHVTGGLERWPASGHCHPNYHQLSRTSANYRSCLRIQWLPRGSTRRTIARDHLWGMQQYFWSRRAPRGSKLVLFLVALARHAWHAPPAAECHTYIQGVRGVNAGSVARRAIPCVIIARCTQATNGLRPASAIAHSHALGARDAISHLLRRGTSPNLACHWFTQFIGR